MSSLPSWINSLRESDPEKYETIFRYSQQQPPANSTTSQSATPQPPAHSPASSISQSQKYGSIPQEHPDTQTVSLHPESKHAPSSTQNQFSPQYFPQGLSPFLWTVLICVKSNCSA